MNSRKYLRRNCSPIGQNNTKHFSCPIRSRHPLEILEIARWGSVPRGSLARTWKLLSRLFSWPDWLPLSLRGWYTANSSILYSKEKTVRILGTLTSILTKCFWAPLFQTNRIWRRIKKVSENPVSLNIFTLNIEPFLWKYHMLPTLFRAALILLRSKQRKHYRGTQREYSSKPLKHSIVTRILPYYRKLTLHEINANR